MYKKKERAQTWNKDRFLKRTLQAEEARYLTTQQIEETYFTKHRLEDQLEKLLIPYFINCVAKHETGAKFKVEGHQTFNKAIEIEQIYEELLNKQNITPPGYSILDSPASISSAQPNKDNKVHASKRRELHQANQPKDSPKEVGNHHVKCSGRLEQERSPKKIEAQQYLRPIHPGYRNRNFRDQFERS